MIRNFQCKSCGVQFSADDSNIVECPFCQSDVVEPVTEKKPILRILMLALSGIAIILVVALLVNNLKHEPEHGSGPTPDVIETNTITEKGEAKHEQALNSETKPEQVNLIIIVGYVMPDKKTKTYSFKIDVNCNVSGEKHYYLAEKGSDNRREYKLENGMIRNVPPAIQSEGGYVLTVEIVNQQGKVASEQKDILGFDEFKDELRPRLTFVEVQKYIDGLFASADGLDSIKKSQRFADDVRIFYVDNEQNCETDLEQAGIMVKIIAGISQPKVTNVEYNSMNLVIAIYLE